MSCLPVHGMAGVALKCHQQETSRSELLSLKLGINQTGEL